MFSSIIKTMGEYEGSLIDDKLWLKMIYMEVYAVSTAILLPSDKLSLCAPFRTEMERPNKLHSMLGKRELSATNQRTEPLTYPEVLGHNKELREISELEQTEYF